MVTIRIKRNIYGNWKAYEGSRMVRELGASDWRAIDWTSERLARSPTARLSLRSDITLEQVEAHRERLAEPIKRRG